MEVTEWDGLELKYSDTSYLQTLTSSGIWYNYYEAHFTMCTSASETLSASITPSSS